MFDRLIISPCCNPEMTLQEAFRVYSRLGFYRFEAFTSWVQSALDYTNEPPGYLEAARATGFQFASFHLPVVKDIQTLEASLQAAQFASNLGAAVVLFKADFLDNYIKWAPEFLDMASSLNLTTTIQNHAHSPLATINDFRVVLDGVNDDRLKTVLEVGHFHSVGVSWKDGMQALEGTIGLVHIKDQVGAVSVPFGKGEIDLPELFRALKEYGYRGDYVVEMEVEDRENTLQYLEQAVVYLKQRCAEFL